MKIFKTALTGLLIVTLGFTSSYAVSAEKDKLSTVNTQKNQLSAEIREKNKEVNTINQNIYSLDQKITSSQDKLDSLQSKLKGLNVDIKLAKETIIQVEADIEENEELLKERLRVMYKTNDIAYLQIIFESSSINELLSNLHNIQRIVSYDKELLEELEVSKKKTQEQRAVLEDSKTKMTQIQAEVKSEQAVMESNLSVQMDEKGKITQDIEKLKIQEQELQKESAAIEKRIKQLTTTTSTQPYSGGIMAWPLSIKGTVTSNFGSRTNPISKSRENHLGVDIAAPKGTPVLAAADGTVISSQYQNSYGNVIMVDHGGGIVTLYAHNSSLVSKKGDKVKKGQTIAKVGSTGYSTGNHLHFEVRVNGKPVNPMGYIK